MRNVIKFGGSSLSDGASMIKAAKQVRADKDNVAVVVSAPGKRRKDDEKMTDLLYRFADGDGAAFEIFSNRLGDIAKTLGINVDVSAELENAVMAASRGDVPYVASRGEYFSAKFMARILGCEFADAADVIVFSGGVLDIPETFRRVREASNGRRIIVPGFYGADERGNIVTFPRGGSDITGSVVAAALGADVYKNCTDVAGFMFCPPEFASASRVTDKLPYDEARFLSLGGAGVIHADAVELSGIYGTVINLRKSFDTDSAGTLIGDFENAHGVYGISGKRISEKDALLFVGVHRGSEAEKAKAAVFAKTGDVPAEMSDEGIIFKIPYSNLGETLRDLSGSL